MSLRRYLPKMTKSGICRDVDDVYYLLKGILSKHLYSAYDPPSCSCSVILCFSVIMLCSESCYCIHSKLCSFLSQSTVYVPKQEQLNMRLVHLQWFDSHISLRIFFSWLESIFAPSIALPDCGWSTGLSDESRPASLLKAS